jgi:hypothetical protein
LKIKSVIELLQSIENNQAVQMYRGQGRTEWSLLPSIARINIYELPMKYDEGWRSVEKDLLERFMKHAVRYIKKEPKSKIEWMINAQHHGVPTRLLDWSTNPLKALYFAVENPNHDDADGVVYLFSPSSWRSTADSIEEDNMLFLTAFHSTYINERIAAQEGCFTIFPFSRKPEDDDFVAMKEGFSPQNEIISMTKLIIDANSKEKIRKQLNRLGISDSNMFPDLDGLSKDIRRQFNCL